MLAIVDTPRFNAAPSVCASAHPTQVSECGGIRTQVLDPELTEADSVAVTAAGGDFVDLTGYTSDPESCPVVIGDMCVHRDANHLTATFTEYFAPLVKEPVDLLVAR